MPSIAVLGAGLAGLAAGRYLQEHLIEAELYERQNRAGGHASSHTRSGFTFDEGPHVSFTKRPEVAALLAEVTRGEFLELQADVRSYYHGTWVRHPIQAHLNGLPISTVLRALAGIVRAGIAKRAVPSNYAEWSTQTLGRFMSEHFVFPYTRKYWTVDAAELATDWIGDRVYAPRVGEAILGALVPTASRHYITSFRYPISGGFGSYADGLTGDLPIRYGREAIGVDAVRKRVTFADGASTHYDALVSSLPLPVLIAAMSNVPAEIQRAAASLRCTSLVLINVGLRSLPAIGAHWMYFYDEGLAFARGSQPHLLAPSNAPPGQGSLQFEVYFSARRPLPSGELSSSVVSQMDRIGLGREDDVILLFENRIPFANVICDKVRPHATAQIRRYLETLKIYTCGRYGDWAYYWTDDSIVSGWRAARSAMTAIGSDD